METIIKYNRPKNTNNRGQNNVTIINNGSGGSSSSDIDFSNIDNYLHWNKSIGQFSLVPRESYNQAEGDNSIAIGEYTQTVNNGELAIGMYNKPESGETYFTIGNGTDDVNRSNLFSVGSANTIVNNHLSGKTAYFSTNIISPTVSGTNAVFDTGVFYSGITSNSAIIDNISGDTVVLSQSLTAPTISGNSIVGKNISGTNASITSLTATAITSNTINVTNKLTTNQLEAVSGYIKTLLSDEITVDYLTVTKAAHFFKLIIDEIKASQGQVIVTPANAVVDKVETVDGNYRCYYRAEDGNGKEIYNSFEPNDQVVCQTFNAATSTSYNISNTYYWRLCLATGTTTTDISGETVNCHYIDLSDTDKDTLSISTPKAGDNIVQLGNRTDASRQAAIIISAYNSEFLDKGLKAPSIVQYYGINDYDLSKHRRNVISRDLNEFRGVFKTSNGNNIEDLIEDVGSGITTYLHYAWANSSDGKQDFTKTNNGGSYKYLGLCSNFNSSDEDLTYSDYIWNKIQGENGTDGKDGASGTSVTIKSTSVTYAVTTSSTQPSDSSFTYTSIPTVNKGNYLWTMTVVTYSDGTVTKTYTVSYKGTDGNDGVDAEFYKLVPVVEKAVVDKNGTLGLDFQYKVAHVVGSTVTDVSDSSSFIVLLYINNTSSNIMLSTGSTKTYTNPNYLLNYHKQSSKPTYFRVCLINSSTNVQEENKIVPVIFDASASLEITDSITATVTANKQETDNNITYLTNSISQVSQKADSIESTVSSHATSINNIQEESSLALQTAQGFEQTVKRLNAYSGNNYFGFSKGVSFYNIGNIQPAIKMYGIEVLGGNTLNRIAQLGFNGAKGYFTVTFDARCSGISTDVNVNLCDVQPYEVNGDTNLGMYTTVTTSWKHYVFKYKDLNQYNLASDPYNGFLDFETISSSSLSTNNRLLIKNLTITNSNVELDFSPAAEDLDGNYSKILDAFEYNTTNTVFDNNIYTSIVNPSAPVIVNGVEDTSNTFKDYVGMYNFSVKSNTCYTLVFYGKSDNDGTEIESFLYPDLLSNGASFDDFYNAVDGRTRTALTTEWKKYYIHWYNQGDRTNSINCIVARKNYGDTGYNSTIYITEPELYEGYIPEGWENQSYSKITQRADRIQLSIADELKDTGIDIEEGKITLNADNTVVNGQLQIHNNKNADAIVLYDSSDNPVVEIKNTEIGDIGNSLKYMSIYTNYMFTSTLPLEPSYLNIIAKSYSFNMSSGDSFTLTLNGQSPSLVINGNPLNMSHFNITYTISLCNSSGNTVYTFTSNSSSWNLSSTSYTATSALTGCYLKVTCKITENSSYTDWDKLMTMNGNITCSFPIWMEVTGINKTVIGSDGFASQQDKYKYIKITSDGIVMRWEADGLKLSNNGLERMCYGDSTTIDSSLKWGSVNRRNVKVFTSTSIYINQYLNVDMFIVNTSSSATVTLPISGVCEGHTFQVKQVGSGALNVVCSQKRILNDNTGLSDLGNSFNIGTKIWQFTAVTINSTLYWISSNLTND